MGDTRIMADLEAKARKATPGPWTASDYMDDGGRGIIDNKNRLIVRYHAPGNYRAEDFDFIAAASPDVVMVLLTERAKLEADLLEAQLEIRAVRGEPEGAVAGWQMFSTFWYRDGDDKLTRCADRDSWWVETSAGRTVASGTAPTLREAMRAADRWTP